jgi:hypothetical protein
MGAATEPPTARGRDLPALAALAALVVGSTLVRWWAARGIPSPWFTPDEQIYGELGKSLYRDGSLQILGGPTPFYSLVYPALVGLPLSLDDLGRGYALLKGLQALVMSLTAVPVYLWARSMARPVWALVAAGLTVAVPGLAFAGFIMSEVAFYPVTCLAAWAMASALAKPTLARQALAVGAIGIATATRLQAIVLVPALVLAVLLKACFDRTWLAGARRFAPALGGLLVLGGGAALVKLAQGSTGAGLLGAYRLTGEVDYGLWDAVRFGLYHAADVLLLTAFFPVLAVALLAVPAFAGRERSETVQAYLAVTLALCLGTVAQVGIFTSRLLGRLAERNLLSLAPVLFVGFAVWLERGAPRPRLAAAAAAAAAFALFLFVPWRTFVSAAAQPDAFSVIPLYRIRVDYPSVDIRLVVLIAALDLLVVFLLLPRRLAWLLPAVAALALVGASFSATRVVASQASGFQTITVGSDNRWIDRAATGEVAFVTTGELAWSGGAPAWANLFWNRRVRHAYDLARAPRILGPLPQARVVPAPDGRLRLANGAVPRVPYVVASTRAAFAGALVASSSARYNLWRVDPPLRLLTRSDGIRLDSSLLSGRATLTAYACRGGEVRIRLLADTPRIVRLLRNDRPLERVELRPGEPWSAAIVAVPTSPGGRGTCTLAVTGGAGVHAEQFEYVGGPDA